MSFFFFNRKASYQNINGKMDPRNDQQATKPGGFLEFINQADNSKPTD